MTDERQAWSTPKFFGILLGLAFVLMFTVNAIFNVWLDFGLSSAAMGAGVGVVSALLLPRWAVYQRMLKKAQDKQQAK